MRFVNLFAQDVWTEFDIVNRGRAIINSVVSETRQNELRTIMLGHIAGMRTASAEELAEIALVQQITEQQVIDNAQARVDNSLLVDVLDYEASIQRLAKPIEPEFLIAEGVPTQEVNPLYLKDIEERVAATAKISNASQEVLDLYALRNPFKE